MGCVSSRPTTADAHSFALVRNVFQSQNSPLAPKGVQLNKLDLYVETWARNAGDETISPFPRSEPDLFGRMQCHLRFRIGNAGSSASLRGD
jgi:hypothetical protein